MANLIITLITITLAVITATMGGIYVSTMIFKEKEYRYEVESGFIKLKIMYDIYVSYKGEKPTVLDWKNELNLIKGPASVTGSNIPKDLTKYNGYVWSYGKVGTRYYFCLNGAYSKTTLNGFIKAQASLKTDYVYIDDVCEATVDDLAAPEVSDTLAITYWLQK